MAIRRSSRLSGSSASRTPSLSLSASGSAEDAPSSASVSPQGVARLERCSNPRMAMLGRWVTDLAARQDAHAQGQLQRALAGLGWMFDHGVRHGGLEALDKLERLQQLFAEQGEVPLAMLDGITQAVQEHMRRALCEASQASAGPPQDHLANRWSHALADLLLNPDGTVDPVVQPVLQQLLASDDWSWLPCAHREDFKHQLEALVEHAELWDQLDLVSGTEPVHPSVQDMLARRGFAGEHTPRRVLAMHLLQTLFSAPWQIGVQNCWQVSANRQIHFAPLPLLGHLAVLLQTGALEFHGARGATDRVVPDPYPTVVMPMAMNAVADHPDFAPELLRSLDSVLPGVCDEQGWATRLQQHHQLALRDGARVCLRDLIDRVIAAELKLPLRYLAGAVAPKTATHQRRLARQQALSWRCLLHWEAQYVNPLASAWQSTESKYSSDWRLAMHTWQPIQRAVLQAMKALPLPEGCSAQWVDEQIKQHLWKAFKSCATLRMEDDPSFDSAKFRLFLRPEGERAGSRGTPVRSLRELVACLEYVARQAAAQAPAPERDQTEAWLSGLSAALHSPAFAAALPPQGPWLVEVGFIKRPDLGGQPDFQQHDHRLGGFFKRVTLSVGPDRFRFGAKPPSRLTRQPTWRSFVQLIERWQSLNTGLFAGFRLQDHLQDHAGVAVEAFNHRSKRGHAFTWTPDHRSVQGAWTGQLSAQDWIRENLKKPMQALMAQRLTAEQATDWLNRVLQQSHLNPGADTDTAALAAELLHMACPHGVPPAGCTRKRLLSALKQLSARPSNNPFLHRDPQRNGLELAVLNTLPHLPAAVYGHSNWPDSPRFMYLWSPWDGEVGHFTGSEMPLGPEHSEVRVHRRGDPFMW